LAQAKPSTSSSGNNNNKTKIPRKERFCKKTRRNLLAQLRTVLSKRIERERERETHKNTQLWRRRKHNSKSVFFSPFSELVLHTLTHTQCVKSCLLRSFRNKTQHHPMRQILSLAFPQQKTTKTTTPNASNPVSGLPRQKRTTPNSPIRQFSRLHSSGCKHHHQFILFLLFLILFFIFSLHFQEHKNHFNKTNSSFLFRVHKSHKRFSKIKWHDFFSKCVFYWVQLLLLVTFLKSSRFWFSIQIKGRKIIYILSNILLSFTIDYSFKF
jgi:hypothetical protein